MCRWCVRVRGARHEEGAEVQRALDVHDVRRHIPARSHVALITHSTSQQPQVVDSTFSDKTIHTGNGSSSALPSAGTVAPPGDRRTGGQADGRSGGAPLVRALPVHGPEDERDAERDQEARGVVVRRAPPGARRARRQRGQLAAEGGRVAPRQRQRARARRRVHLRVHSLRHIPASHAAQCEPRGTMCTALEVEAAAVCQQATRRAAAAAAGWRLATGALMRRWSLTPHACCHAV